MAEKKIIQSFTTNVSSINIGYNVLNLKKTREISCYQTNVYVDYLELSSIV